jgi:uncharacterized protein
MYDKQRKREKMKIPAAVPQTTAQDQTPIQTQAQTESLPKLIFLHLFPGLLVFLVYLLLAPRFMARGFPPMLAILLASALVILPVEWAELLRRGWKLNGRLSLKGVVTLTRRLPAWQYIILPLGFLVVAFLISGAAGLAEAPLRTFLARWLPEWFFLKDFSEYAAYSRSALLWTLVANVLINFFAAPITEELYFRGYLLPRLSRFGKWAPLLNGLLFTIYHFWQPYSYLSIFLTLTPLVYLVWRKQNVALAIICHCAINIIGNLLIFAYVLGR